MAGGTKRLPRAVREQQMLDAAVLMFSRNGYHETSMDAIAAEAEISKPMLYLYYGSKEQLFGACLNGELSRFIEAVRADIDLKQSPKDLLTTTIRAFMHYIDANRASWIVLYQQATSSQMDSHTVPRGAGAGDRPGGSGAERGNATPRPGHGLSHDGRRSGGRGRGGRDQGQHRRGGRQRCRRAADQPDLARFEGSAGRQGRGRQRQGGYRGRYSDLTAPGRCGRPFASRT